MPSPNTTSMLKALDVRKPATFSLRCVRRLYQYLGEFDALVELTELSARSFIHDAQESGDVAEYVTRRSQQHNVRVNVRSFSLFSTHLASSYLVTVATATERFLQEFRREHVDLFRRDWVGDAKDSTRLEVTLKNVARSEEDARKAIGPDLISRFDYYRLLRNEICHAKDEDKIETRSEKFASLEPLSDNNSALNSLAAPNEPKKLTFDDFVLFTRVVKKIAEGLNALACPSYEELKCRFPLESFRKRICKPERLRNAVCCHLRTEFGLDPKSAEEIRDEILVQ
jgi:hypothetical protein